MQKTSENRILILSGPSGAGKTTLSHELIRIYPDTVFAISHTTRNKRPHEQEGVDYYFVSTEEFQHLIEQGEMLEYASVYHKLYGTSRASIEMAAQDGKNIILDIDWQGARSVKRAYPEAVSIFILPPDEKEAKDRLISRAGDSDEVIEARMSEFEEQLSHQNEFDHVIINDKIDSAVDQLAKFAPFR
jgi:guanylate kinase